MEGLGSLIRVVLPEIPDPLDIRFEVRQRVVLFCGHSLRNDNVVELSVYQLHFACLGWRQEPYDNYQQIRRVQQDLRARLLNLHRDLVLGLAGVLLLPLDTIVQREIRDFSV